jgi:glycosyltransferase involved in cell wall biosynthesis
MEPLISIKIPTYNCSIYLVETINSILNQKHIDLDLLDIEVVDDCSTDNPELVTKDLGKGRVKFYKNAENLGAVRNFNICINRSRCNFIHILHGDDYLDELFYFEIFNVIRENPKAVMLTTRVNFINENNVILGQSAQFKEEIESFITSTPFQFAGVVFNVQKARELNSFDENLIHLNDRDLWLRLFNFSMTNCIHLNNILGYYRIFEGNDSSRLIRSGKNITDLQKFYNKNSEILGLSEGKIKRLIYKFYRKQLVKLTTRSEVFANFLVALSIIRWKKMFIWSLKDRF